MRKAKTVRKLQSSKRPVILSNGGVMCGRNRK